MSITMRTCVSIMIALALSIARSDIVKSSNSAKSISSIASSSSFQNPYITDGLIAMFDGEWNVGFGKHNPSATSWKDLVSGQMLTFSSGPAITNDPYIVATSNGMEIAGMLGNLTHLGIQTALNSTTFTIEWTFIPNPAYNRSRYYLIDGSWRNNEVGWYWGLCNLRTTSAWRKYPYEGEPCYLSISDNRGNRQQRIACKHFGILDYVESGTDTENYYKSPTFIILGNGWRYGDFSFHGIVHAIRFYSRALTQEEIEHNFNIDKERFGILQ